MLEIYKQTQRKKSIDGNPVNYSYWVLRRSAWSDGKRRQEHIKTLGDKETKARQCLKELLKSGVIDQPDFDRLSERFNTDIWGTPKWVLDKVRIVFDGPIDLDPCTQPENPCKALKFFTQDDDGLKQSWGAGNVYCNPPYSTPKPWLDKIATSYQSGQVRQSIALVKSGVIQNKGTRDAIQSATVKGLWNGRLKFESLRNGRTSKSPDFDVAIVYWGPNPALFKEQFSECCAEIW